MRDLTKKNFGSRFAAFRNTAAALAVTAFVAGNAHAGALADAVTDGVDTAELMLIGAVALGVTGIIMLIRGGRKAGGG